ncbi:MAG: type II toxin-antitoxin system RelE/ParE family toxin [Aquirufa sp.]
MESIRRIIAYKNHFEDFLLGLDIRTQNKIHKIISLLETMDKVPSNYLKHISGTKGLYEARVQLGSNIWRIFCFFDEGNLVILLNGFMKKTEKTPRTEIEKAKILMRTYYEEKNGN